MSNVKSQMVMAKKYELQVKVPGKTAYQKDGQRKLVHGNKFLSRWWVESRNLQENNELYEIDEEATDEAYIQREKNIKANAAKAKREKVSMADLVDTIAGKVSEPKKAKEVEVEKEAEEGISKEAQIAHLQQQCKEAGLKYHPKAGITKLTELLNKQ